MAELKFSENNIYDIVTTIDSLFRYTDNGNGTDDIELNRFYLCKVVMINWENGITSNIPNFLSLLLKEIADNLYLSDMKHIFDGDSITLLYNDCEIEMDLTNDNNGKETFFYFNILAYPNDTPCVSDDDNA